MPLDERTLSRSLALLFREGKLYWIGFAVLLAVVLALLWTEPSLQRLRIGGWLFELLGIAAAAAGVFEIARQSSRLGLADGAQPAAAALAHLAGSAPVGEAGIPALATGRAWHGTVMDTPLDERVAALENVLRQTSSRGEELRQFVLEELALLDRALAEQHRTFEEAFAGIRFEQEAAGARGASLAVIGLFALGVGLTLTTIPAELLAMFGT
jgi:hypothetical protein